MQKKNTTIVVIVLVTVIVLTMVIGATLVYFASKNKENSSSTKTSIVEQSDESFMRDKVRKNDAVVLMSNLITVVGVQRKTVPNNAEGYDMFSQQYKNEAAFTDPLLKKPYKYVSDTSNMQVGDVTFRVGETCASVGESDSTAEIMIPKNRASRAVAIKLESGKIYCTPSF